MDIIIDFNHPADYHFFKHFIKRMKLKGYTFIFIARDKDCLPALLDNADIAYISRGKGGGNVLCRSIYLIKTSIFLYKIIKRSGVSLALSFGSPYLAIAARLRKVRSITIDDTENNFILHQVYSRFTSIILTPACFEEKINSKQKFFPGQKAWAYLHPEEFSPDEAILGEYGIKWGEVYVMIRLVKKNSTHDLGHSGIQHDFLDHIVNRLSEYGKVLISSEYALPGSLQRFLIKGHPSNIHHLMAFASLFYGESATMAAEAAILGVPSILIDRYGRGYTKILENDYGLIMHYGEHEKDKIKSLEKAIELLKNPGIKVKWKVKHQQLIKHAVNVTTFLVDYISKYV